MSTASEPGLRDICLEGPPAAEGLATFSQAGSQGWNPKNLRRGRYEATGLDKSPVPFYWFNMDLWDKEQGRLVKTTMPVVLPHEVVQWFLGQRPSLDLQARDAAPWWPHFAMQCASVGIVATDTLPVPKVDEIDKVTIPDELD